MKPSSSIVEHTGASPQPRAQEPSVARIGASNEQRRTTIVKPGFLIVDRGRIRRSRVPHASLSSVGAHPSRVRTGRIETASRRGKRPPRAPVSRGTSSLANNGSVAAGSQVAAGGREHVVPAARFTSCVAPPGGSPPENARSRWPECMIRRRRNTGEAGREYMLARARFTVLGHEGKGAASPTENTTTPTAVDCSGGTSASTW
jgi:hypothetical protein